MIHHKTLIIALIIKFKYYTTGVNGQQSHTSERLFIQRITPEITEDSKFFPQYLVDYTYSGYELYPWSQESIYDRNIFSYSTDILPKDVLKLLNTSECSHFIVTIGGGHWDYDRFSNSPIEIVPNGATLMANLPSNFVQQAWPMLTHGLWGLTGVSFNMSKSPIVLANKPFVGKNKSVLDDLKLRLDQVYNWVDDTNEENYYLDTRENPRQASKLETMEDLLYKISRRERALYFDNLTQENLCTDNLYNLERLLPCGFRKGFAMIFSDLHHIISSEYKGVKLSASLHNGRYYYSLNIHYVTIGEELDNLKLLDNCINKCHCMNESQLFIRSSQADIAGGSNMGDGSYIYIPKVVDLKVALKTAKPIDGRGVTVTYEELDAPGVNRRTSSTLLITIRNPTDKVVKIASITVLPKWIIPLGHTLTIKTDNNLLCVAEDCFHTLGIESQWIVNNQLTPDTRSNIQFVTKLSANSRLYISFQILKTLLGYYSMGLGELRGQILPGTVLFYQVWYSFHIILLIRDLLLIQDQLSVWPESYRNYLSKLSALASIGLTDTHVDMTQQEQVPFRSLLDEMIDNSWGFAHNTKCLVSNPLMIKILLSDNTVSYNAMVIIGIAIGMLFAFVYKSTIEDVDKITFTSTSSVVGAPMGKKID